MELPKIEDFCILNHQTFEEDVENCCQEQWHSNSKEIKYLPLWASSIYEDFFGSPNIDSLMTNSAYGMDKFYIILLEPQLLTW